MTKLLYILLVIGLIICFFKIEIFFIKKSREKFKEQLLNKERII
jgi:hypothetical protein